MGVIGVFGGSGFSEFLAGAEEVSVETPFGPPSDSYVRGEVDGTEVVFLPRHGRGHEIPPHRVNFRANLWGFHQLGVTRVISPCAAGSLREELAPGDLVVLDQLVDRTRGRGDTYFDGPVVGHLSFADPYCPELATLVAPVAREQGIRVHEGGTVVVVQGPRFSTRAESAWFRREGWDVVNMTQYPEVALARELGMCFSGLAFVTDYDTGVAGRDDIAPVTIEEVFAVLAANVDRTRDLLRSLIPAIPGERSCPCPESAPAGGPFS